MITDKQLLEKYHIKPIGYTKKNNAIIIETKDNKFVLKKRTNQDNLFNYLKTRSFNYFPDNYSDESDQYDIFEYQEDYKIHKDEKGIDLINIVSLLHAKTTHYRDIDVDDYKKTYEELKEKLNYLDNYYGDLIDLVDTEIYMAPSSYLLARNISKIISLINYCKEELDDWYKIIKEEPKERVALIHNNLELDHLMRNSSSYLISWDKAKQDNPIYDLHNFYRNNYKDLEFSELLNIYESRYPLLDNERKLLFILISIPDKIEFTKDEYLNTKKVNELLYYIYKTDTLISPYYPKDDAKE